MNRCKIIKIHTRMNEILKNICDYFAKLLNNDFINALFVAIFTATATFFDSTLTFLFALLAGFFVNIIAGFRADEVRVKLHRIFPPMVIFQNFNGNKFKDSLLELALIVGITYIIKGIILGFKYNEISDFAVQWLFIIAVYYYIRNSLRNLSMVYPRMKWIRVTYILISFKFRGLIGDEISDIIDKEEKE
ncbi:MAG: hypothetical protein WBJ13_13860 [Sedimentibacter sp.]